jgi:adenylate kinase family enzyme
MSIKIEVAKSPDVSTIATKSVILQTTKCPDKIIKTTLQNRFTQETNFKHIFFEFVGTKSLFKLIPTMFRRFKDMAKKCFASDMASSKCLNEHIHRLQ